MKFLILRAFLLGLMFCTLGWVTVAFAEDGAGLEEPAILSFQDWKIKQIESAQVTYNVASVDRSLQTRSVRGTEKKAIELQSRMDQAKLHLEVAKELALHDYFVLYAAQLKSQDDFKALVSQLTPEEAAFLLKAYAERLVEQQNQAPDVPQGQSALLILSQ